MTSYLEELRERGGGCAKILVAHDVVAEPGRDLAAVAGACKPLISEDDGTKIVTVTDDPSHRLIHCPAEVHTDSQSLSS